MLIEQFGMILWNDNWSCSCNGIIATSTFAVIFFKVLFQVIWNRIEKNCYFISEKISLFSSFSITAKLLISSRKHFNRRTVDKIEMLHVIRLFPAFKYYIAHTSRFSFHPSFPPSERIHITHFRIKLRPTRSHRQLHYFYNNSFFSRDELKKLYILLHFCY